MILPPWWPRVRCIYCGELVRDKHPVTREKPKGWLVCWRHVDLLEHDPQATLARNTREGYE